MGTQPPNTSSMTFRSMIFLRTTLSSKLLMISYRDVPHFLAKRTTAEPQIAESPTNRSWMNSGSDSKLLCSSWIPLTRALNSNLKMTWKLIKTVGITERMTTSGHSNSKAPCLASYQIHSKTLTMPPPRHRALPLAIKTRRLRSLSSREWACKALKVDKLLNQKLIRKDN